MTAAPATRCGPRGSFSTRTDSTAADSTDAQRNVVLRASRLVEQRSHAELLALQFRG